MILWIGTYTRDGGAGIYPLRMDLATGELHRAAEPASVENPSYLRLHPRLPVLYAVSEQDRFQGEPGGGISALAVDRETGALRLLHQQNSRGGAPCYLGTDPDGATLLVANYGDGSAAALALGDDGAPAPASSVVRHDGSGPHPDRQQGPHAHCALTSPDGRYALVVDLGIDRVVGYRLEAHPARLLPDPAAGVRLAPGSGPRHLLFHPAAPRAYLISELASAVTLLDYDTTQGALHPRQTLSTLPADFRGENTAAAVRLHPSGRWLYASNRGHDSVAVFALDPHSGHMSPLQHAPSGGRGPRDIAPDPSGRWLLATNQGSNAVATLAIDPERGTLSATDMVMQVPAPVCVEFLHAEP